MFWTCDECSEWGVADTEVDTAVARRRHLNTHRGEAPELEDAEETPEPVTVLTCAWVAWGTTALLGLLSTHFPALVGVLPLAGLVAFVATFGGQ
jgi:hypothetical protein